MAYADLNKRAISPLLDKFIQKSTKVLIISGITLHPHAGGLRKILDCVKLAKTFLASAYYVFKLTEDRGTRICLREKQKLEKLATYMDPVVEINSSLH